MARSHREHQRRSRVEERHVAVPDVAPGGVEVAQGAPRLPDRVTNERAAIRNHRAVGHPWDARVAGTVGDQEGLASRMQMGAVSLGERNVLADDDVGEPLVDQGDVAQHVAVETEHASESVRCARVEMPHRRNQTVAIQHALERGQIRSQRRRDRVAQRREPLGFDIHEHLSIMAADFLVVCSRHAGRRRGVNATNRSGTAPEGAKHGNVEQIEGAL